MKPITSLSRGDLFMPSYDNTNVYTFCEEGEHMCTVRRVAFLMQDRWHMTEGMPENYQSSAHVQVVKAIFLCEGDF